MCGCVIDGIKANGKEQVIECFPPTRQAAAQPRCTRGSNIGPGKLNEENYRNDKAMHCAYYRAGDAYLIGTGSVFVRMAQDYKCN